MSPLKIVGGIALVIILAIAYYGISPLFENVEVRDELPDIETPIVETPVDDESVFCTQDAKQCPDGSYVGRIGPKCEFAPCQTAAGAPVIGTALHPASGTARVVETSGTRYVRYENFKTINGPDLYIYLAKDLDAKEFVDLGRIRGTEGNINYEIPEGVNVTDYSYVLTWCKQFNTLFNYAKLTP
jgi:hypothetical protein